MRPIEEWALSLEYPEKTAQLALRVLNEYPQSEAVREAAASLREKGSKGWQRALALLWAAGQTDIQEVIGIPDEAQRAINYTYHGMVKAWETQGKSFDEDYHQDIINSLYLEYLPSFEANDEEIIRKVLELLNEERLIRWRKKLEAIREIRAVGANLKTVKTTTSQPFYSIERRSLGEREVLEGYHRVLKTERWVGEFKLSTSHQRLYSSSASEPDQITTSTRPAQPGEIEALVEVTRSETMKAVGPRFEALRNDLRNLNLTELSDEELEQLFQETTAAYAREVSQLLGG